MANTPLGPVAPSERIELLDVLRGLALFGVLYVNLHDFGSEQVTGPAHTAARFFMLSVFESKFFGLFSLLFGMGFALQLRRADAGGTSLFRVYWRRLAVLFVLGWVHTTIYSGDIIRLYAVLGFVLFLFRRWPPRRLVAVAILIPVVSFRSWYLFRSVLGWVHTAFYTGDIIWLSAVLGFVLLLFRRWPPRRLVAVAILISVVSVGSWYLFRSDLVDIGLGPATEEVQSSPLPDLERAAVDPGASRQAALERTFTEGSLSEVLWANLLWDRGGIHLEGYGPPAFVLFLIGLAIVRAGILDDLEVHRTAIQRLMWWMAGLGVPGAVIRASRIQGFDLLASSVAVWGSEDPSLVMQTLVAFLSSLSNLTLALAYASFVALHLSAPGWYRVLRPLAPVGRMALSVYIGQSIVYTTLYYGYGFGLYGHLGPAHILPIAAAMFGVEILVCRWWMRRFRYGPLEWLWRSATYLRWQPM